MDYLFIYIHPSQVRTRGWGLSLIYICLQEVRKKRYSKITTSLPFDLFLPRTPSFIELHFCSDQIYHHLGDLYFIMLPFRMSLKQSDMGLEGEYTE